MNLTSWHSSTQCKSKDDAAVYGINMWVCVCVLCTCVCVCMCKMSQLLHVLERQ